VYDDDGQEVILSSGRKGTYLQSPKRAAKDEGWTDLDAEDEGDPAMVAEYVIDAFNYMLAIEVCPSYSPLISEVLTTARNDASSRLHGETGRT
jgi:hypothetical protein